MTSAVVGLNVPLPLITPPLLLVKLPAVVKVEPLLVILILPEFCVKADPEVMLPASRLITPVLLLLAIWIVCEAVFDLVSVPLLLKVPPLLIGLACVLVASSVMLAPDALVRDVPVFRLILPKLLNVNVLPLALFQEPDDRNALPAMAAPAEVVNILPVAGVSVAPLRVSAGAEVPQVRSLSIVAVPVSFTPPRPRNETPELRAWLVVVPSSTSAAPLTTLKVPVWVPPPLRVSVPLV